MKKKMRTLLFATILGAAVLGLTGCGGSTVDLNEYVNIEVSGYDSMGQAYVSFDYRAFEEDFGDKIKANISNQGGDAAKMSLELQFGEEPYSVMLNYCMDYEVDKTTGLSNGEVVKLVWDCEDENAKNYFNCTLKHSDIEYTVEGLEEIATFNPFEYVTVDIAGIAPRGSVTITPNYDKMEMQYLSFSADKSGGLSNGDTVVVTANIQGGLDSFIQQFNAIPSPVSMEFPVEGLASYVTSTAEIDETTMNAIKQQAEDAYKAFWVNLEGNMDGLHALNYIGNYFMSRKQGTYADESNQLYMVYKVDCSWDGASYPHYVYVKFADICVDEAGNCTVDMSDYEIVSEQWHPTGSWMFYYYGYGTLEELYNDRIASKIDVYAYENNVAE